MAKTKPPSGDNTKNSGVSPHIFELSRTLNDFSASPRFNLLKTLQVGRFIDKQSIGLGAIEDFTFEKLIELGSKKLTKLHWLTPDQTENLVKLLRGLTENGGLAEMPKEVEPASALSSSVELPNQGDGSDEIEEIDGVQLFASVEGEIKLREVLKALTNHERFNEIANKLLSTFWKPEWTRAPFEEALTLRQIAEFDVGTLLKKRTMSSRKVTTIVLALRQALEALNSGQSTVVPALAKLENNPAPQLSALQRPEKRNSPWTVSVVRGGTSARAAVCLFERECDHARDCTDPAWIWIAEVPEIITADEFLQILAVMENGVVPNAEDAESLEVARRKLTVFFSHGRYPIVDLFKAAIASVGTPMTALAAGLGQSALVSPAREMAAYLILFAINAEIVQLLDETLPGFWTTRPAAIHAIVEAILQKLPLTDQELDHLLRELVNSELVKPLGELLRSRLDSVDGRWSLTKR